MPVHPLASLRPPLLSPPSRRPGPAPTYPAPLRPLYGTGYGCSCLCIQPPQYHKELLVAGSGWSSGEKHVTRDELERLLTWKVAQLVAANPPELVVRCSAAAFRLLPDVLTAVTELCARRSVGAATASVLAAGAPEAADFMSHEAVARVSGLPAQQYILQHYRLYLGQMQDHAKALSQDSLCSFPASASGPRTRQPAETALWTWAVGRKMCPGLLPDLSPGTVNIHVIRPAKRRRTQAD
ncbi:uncharacterized protein LOC126086948 isoform X3 [Elephas maximus indicus]|uniref:uncharacterized protein LOC126086948 isoform X3 n=1 Tax=Elephas maximus indicus TaxID=99487 RepID=UPI0021161CF9|nr:uncharacterized protein LOC126086948 isoform X3 [Elephas maximus indicus]